MYTTVLGLLHGGCQTPVVHGQEPYPSANPPTPNPNAQFPELNPTPQPQPQPGDAHEFHPEFQHGFQHGLQLGPQKLDWNATVVTDTVAGTTTTGVGSNQTLSAATTGAGSTMMGELKVEYDRTEYAAYGRYHEHDDLDGSIQTFHVGCQYDTPTG